MKKIFPILLVCFFLNLLSGCSVVKESEITDTAEKTTNYKNLSDFDGSKIALISGSAFSSIIDPIIADATYNMYSSVSDELLALETNKVDVIAIDVPVANLLVAKNDNITIFSEKIVDDNYGFAVEKGSELGKKANNVLNELRENGTLDELAEYWFANNDKELTELTYKTDFDGSAGTIKYGLDASQDPMSYISTDGAPIGYDVDVIRRIAYELNMNIEFTVMNFDSLLAALSSGKVDVVGGCMSMTEERMKSVDFVGPYYEGGIVLVVKKSTLGIEETTQENIGFFANLRSSFEKTFIVEDRYLYILSGLMITILISILSMIVGTIFGVLICCLYRSKYGVLQGVAKFYIRIIQGTPIVVMLMILYYIVFGTIDVPAIVVAIIGFSLNFAAYTAEMFRTGIDATDKGQIEAAQASGFSKMQTFVYITLPQAARHIIPVYRGEFVGMVKMTSVVGYIAIQDLTKVSDIIRSRTYEAFFPLIATAAIYFIVTYVFILVLNKIEASIDPKKRKRSL